MDRVLPLVNVTAEAVLYYQLPMVLAVAGGIWAFAPRQYFPFAAHVHGTFQSFKILPTVLMTIAKPFGHVFKVTPKGASAKKSDYDRTIFARSRWIPVEGRVHSLLRRLRLRHSRTSALQYQGLEFAQFRRWPLYGVGYGSR